MFYYLSKISHFIYILREREKENIISLGTSSLSMSLSLFLSFSFLHELIFCHLICKLDHFNATNQTVF